DYWMQEMIDGDLGKRTVWAKVLESRQQKGLPYIFFTDNINRNKPQVYKDKNLKISSSNLCSEIALPSTFEESFICCLSSMNLELYDEWKGTDAVKTATYFLDAVLQEFIAKTEDNYYLASANRFAKRHRALGLGAMGWHSYLQKNNIAFESLRAKSLNNEIFKYIHDEAYKASAALAEIYGEPEILKGYGRRNTTLLAVAPTTSSSAILGQTSPGIEPYSSNYYKAGLAKGNFMRKNKWLKALLKEKRMDNEDTWRSIMLNRGSVQHLGELTDGEKAVFKTFKEISQLEIVQQAGIRQKYIDQAQSLNLNIPSDLPVKEVNRLMIEAWKLGVKTLYYQRSQSVSKEFVANMVSCSSCEA
ncbi:MAG: ribonucleotide-diphosphate reductase subunit alpha, partial [Bacteroidota bacterium]